MFRRRLNRVLPSLLLLAVLGSGLFIACGPATPTPEPDQVSVQLNWVHEAEFSGYYMAEEKGFYADDNLAVTINAGGIGISPSEGLLNEEVDFAILGLNEFKTVLDSDAGPTAVAAVFQVSPLVLFALSDSGIQSPHDMAGRRVAIKTAEWREIIHNTLRGAGADPAEIVEVEVEYDAIEKLYNGEVDVWSGYVHDEPTEAQLAGYDVNLIFSSEYGVGAYEGLIVVRQDTLEQDAELVKRFVRATLRGWQYAIEHPDEAAEVIYKWQPDNSLEFHRIAMRALVPLIDTGQVSIGWVDAERWQFAMGDAYNSEQPAYTMRFVEAAQE